MHRLIALSRLQLLAKELRKETSIILQCIRHLCKTGKL